MAQVLTKSDLRTYFSMEIMKISQRHPNISKTPLYPDHLQVQNKFSIEDGNDTKKLSQTKAWWSLWKYLPVLKNCTMYKPAHRLVSQINVLVSTQHRSSLKSASLKGVSLKGASSLMCWVIITGLDCVFHFVKSEIKWRQEDTTAL